MNKLTAEVARMDIGHLREQQANPHVGLSLKEEKYLQALEIALLVLERKGGWISCSERMPPEREQVILWDADLDEHTSGHYSDQTGNFYCGGMIIDNEITHWQPAPTPPQPSTTPQIDNDVWIEWGGGECPVPDNKIVDLKYRDGRVFERELAGNYGWTHGYYHFMTECAADIIAYRVIEEVRSEK